MVFGKLIVDEVNKQAKTAKKSSYWLPCPGCARLVVRKELIRKGCYLCGWQGTEEEIEQAESEGPSRLNEDSTLGEIKRMTSYRMNCPHCGARVVREHLIEKGCYRCGWKPT
ncbi:MAG: hypothetical protein ACE5H6_03350 [Dehalococcoidia bacterium]